MMRKGSWIGSKGSLFVAIAATVTLSNAMNPVVIKGYKFFDSVTGEEIVIRGIDYYPRPNSGPYNRNSVDFYSEDYRHVWERDIPYLQQLGVNAIQLYSVDPNENHDAFMCALNQAGIYALIGIAADCPNCAVSGEEAPGCYSAELKSRGQAVVREFAKYSNTLAFSAGNEVNHAAPPDKPEWNAPCLKKFMRDIRQFMDTCPTIRNVPVGLVSADSNRDENAKYYNCQGDKGDNYEGAEWYGLNAYVFCDHQVTEYKYANGLVILQQMFKKYHYSIPAVLTEYGCLSPTFETIDGYEGQRDFKETEWLVTEPDLRQQFSGGLVFEYSTELQNAIGTSAYPFTTFGAQNYGIGFFEPQDCDDVSKMCTFKPLPNYYNLQAVLNRTSGVASATINSFNVPRRRQKRSKCPKQFKPLSSYNWKADDRNDLPCPRIGSDSSFTCPINLDALRGRYGHQSYQGIAFDFPDEATIIFGLACLMALAAVCYLMGKEVESEMSDLDLLVAKEGSDFIHDASVESTSLMASRGTTSASHRTAYHAIDSDGPSKDV